MSVEFPEAVNAFGTSSIGVMTAYDGDGTLSLATDVNASTALVLSCFLYGDDWSVSTNQNVGTGPRRFCSKKVPQEFGQETVEVTALQYLYAPQGDPDADNNKAKTLLTSGMEVWLIDRRGVDAETEPFKAGDVVDLHLVQLGVQNKTKTGTGEFDVFTITQNALHRRTIEDVTIAA